MQQTLLMFDEILQKLKKTSLESIERGYGFLKVNKSLAQIKPYVDNAIVFSNLYLGTHISQEEEEAQDMMLQAEKCRRQIDKLHQALQKKISFQPDTVDFYSREGIHKLENYVFSTEKKPLKEAMIERYFLKGLLDSALAVAQNRQRGTEYTMVDNIQDNDVAQKMGASLEKSGVYLNDDEIDVLDEAIVDGCSDLFFGHEPLTFKSIQGTLMHSLKEALSIKEDVLSKTLSEQNKFLLDTVKNARSSMKNHKRAVRNLSLLSQEIAFVAHDKIQEQIYRNLLSVPVKEEDNTWTSAHFPEYLLPYKNSPEVQEILQHMTDWENFEAESKNFDKEQVYSLVGRMGVRWLACVYQDMQEYEEKLDLIDDFDDEEDDDYHVHEVDHELEDDILAYTKELVTAAQYVEKYLNIDINQTGVSSSTIENLMKKDHLESQDVDLLGELFDSLAQEMEDYDTLKKWDDVDYDQAVDAVLAMPHGAERKEALQCLKGMFDISNSEFDDELEVVMFDLDKELNRSYYDLNQTLEDFVQTGIEKYPDVQKDGAENIIDQIKLGVLSVYVAPLYLGEKTGSQEQVLMFIENYDAYTPEAQDFLNGLSKYYGDKVLAFHQHHVQEASVSSQLKECLESYDEITSAMNYVDSTIELLDENLADENLLEDQYKHYREQKAQFEIPKNFDLQLAVQLYKNFQERR